MATVPADNMSLVDLYANRGNAVPILVECALDEIREADDGLFGWERILVSNATRSEGRQPSSASKRS